jgi:hypothetical protein
MQDTMKQTAKDRNTLWELAHADSHGWHRVHGRSVPHSNVERAHPPETFHFPYLVGRPTPYQACDRDGREQFCGGVLEADQVVWLQQPLQIAKSSRRVTAFTPTAGLIRLETRRLTGIRKAL